MICSDLWTLLSTFLIKDLKNPSFLNTFWAILQQNWSFLVSVSFWTHFRAILSLSLFSQIPLHLKWQTNEKYDLCPLMFDFSLYFRRISVNWSAHNKCGCNCVNCPVASKVMNWRKFVRTKVGNQQRHQILLCWSRYKKWTLRIESWYGEC